MRSQYARGSSPSSFALRNTFCECSSSPITNWTFKPGEPLVARDDVGGNLSYAVPRCGRLLT